MTFSKQHYHITLFGIFDTIFDGCFAVIDFDIIPVALSGKSNGKYIEIDDRKAAIKYCIENAKKGDMIVLLGKGHEDYQEIKGVKYHFDEREAIAEVKRELGL